MTVALLIVLAAVAVIGAGLALALLARHDDVVVDEQKRGYPGDRA